MKIDYVRPKITSYQRAILDSPARFTICEASTKSGKTASHIIWLFEQALNLKANQRVWWVAPVYGQAEIAFNRMKAQVTDRSFFKVNETKLRLTLPTGSIIEFKSAEKPDNLYGDDVFACVFDEFTRAREEAWFALRTTLTATRGKCKLIGNAKGKKNWGYKLGAKARAGEQDYEYHRITAYDAVNAGILDKEEIEQAKRDLPETVFNELYLAQPNDDASNPFGIDYIKNSIQNLSLLPPVCYGIDLAKSFDWTVIVGLDKRGGISVFKRFQSDWKQTTDTIKLTVKQHPCTIDATGVGDPIVEELQRTNHNIEGFKYSSGSKQQIMEGLVTAVQKREIGILDGIMREEMESFEYEYTRTGVRYTAPQGMHDDCVNALALARNCFLKNRIGGNFFVMAT
ncbi:Terminase RNaseH-like domain containing protein [uncultured Caudovirales phage]|uniref:Terminase RNaseH-like domain containing protein n=1 Tax=uncultured Caudovirales phage TaxID=2100421 RepID=A0A6J7XMW0_9CAUD|nr:Terminase RNaseH-like domain containing protein [uncultured Caudovirales phage]CAB5229310.1 Terminase RNaseH-like domain containing protein [uncultured Caudovirales phage]